MHGAAGLQRGTLHSISDCMLLLHRQQTLASLVTIRRVLARDEKNNPVAVRLDGNRKKAIALPAEWTVKLLAMKSSLDFGNI